MVQQVSWYLVAGHIQDEVNMGYNGIGNGFAVVVVITTLIRGVMFKKKCYVMDWPFVFYIAIKFYVHILR